MKACTQERNRRVRAAIGVAGAVVTAVAAVTACEPTTGGLSSAAVAVTTDRTGTSTLERLDFDVRWLSCTASVGGAAAATVRAGASPPVAVKAGTGENLPAATPSATDPASVDCRGETGDGKEITLRGKVTDEQAGRCVRGELTARIGGRIVFEATMLGNCAAPASSTPQNVTRERPGTPRVTVTVTVTAPPVK